MKFVTIRGMSCEGEDNFHLTFEDLKACGWKEGMDLYEIPLEDYHIGFELPNQMPENWSINNYDYLVIDGEETDAAIVETDRYELIGANTNAELLEAYYYSNWRSHWKGY